MRHRLRIVLPQTQSPLERLQRISLLPLLSQNPAEQNQPLRRLGLKFQSPPRLRLGLLDFLSL